MRLAKRYTCVHARGWATAAPTRRLDRVAHAAVGQPARVALVQALMPGQVQLSYRGQHGALASALGTRAGQCQAAGQAYVEDLACGKAREKVRRCPRDPPLEPGKGVSSWVSPDLAGSAVAKRDGGSRSCAPPSPEHCHCLRQCWVGALFFTNEVTGGA